jgi:transposase
MSSLPNGQVRISTHIGQRPTYLHAAEAAGITWPLSDDLSEAQLRRRLFPPDASPPQNFYAPVDFAATHQELKRKGVTKQLLWEEYAEANPDNHYQRAQFFFHYQQWRDRLRLSMRQTHHAGEKMFVDYAGPTVPIVNPTTGEIMPAQIFVAVLGASNYTYAEATFTQQLHDWIGSHVRAFTFFGGVTQLIIVDNLKSGVTRADRYEPEVNRSYQEMLAHYATTALPTRPKKPRDKAKVEYGVQLVERWILARLRHQTFFSLTDLNQRIGELLTLLNQKPFRKLPGSRRSQFESLDLPALLPLPATPYEFAEWRHGRVHIDYHVEVDGHYYSVPYQLRKCQLDIRLTATIVEFLHQNRLVTSHPRSDRIGAFTTIPEHMPSHHRAHYEWSPGRFLKWAVEIGPYTRDFTRGLIESRKHPELGYRSCLGLLSLAKQYTPQRLEAACQRALALGTLRQASVRSILERGLDSQPLPETDIEAADKPLVHENIRGAAYYR